MGHLEKKIVDQERMNTTNAELALCLGPTKKVYELGEGNGQGGQQLVGMSRAQLTFFPIIE